MLAALVLAGLSGCCCGDPCGEPWGGCYPCGKNWCGSQCGCLFWHEWFSLPPQCCDPCDQCGNFIGPRLNDGLYSHGNDYQGWCEHRHGQTAHYQAEEVQGVPQPAEPIPAEQPYDPRAVEESYPSGAQPMRNRPRAARGGYGRQASYEEPLPQAARRPPQVDASRRLFSSMGQSQFESRGPSRTLAKPSRTRLFSR